MASKAIHLELSSEMTTNAFLSAFNRFISRRGLPRNLYSDNDSNFVGAKRKMDELSKMILDNSQDEHVLSELNQREIKWHMIPPSAPHFGGLWEAGIKSTKMHIRRVIGDAALTFEEMTTLLCQVEAILNSRPLVALNDDTSDLEVLTPGHFLIGSALTSIPGVSNDDHSLCFRNRWELVQGMARGFWRRWQQEYLTTLQQRPRWKNVSDNLQINDLVLIKEPHTAPLEWPRGRIVEVYPGADGNVRVVTVKTAKGTLKRPIAKLCRLVGTRSE